MTASGVDVGWDVQATLRWRKYWNNAPATTDFA